MLRLPSSVRTYLCRKPTDMRRSFDRLALMASQKLMKNQSNSILTSPMVGDILWA